ncbi:MAG: hypothetical protein KAW12_21825 [Candidatus Aminicenantes bacterium]|nr:hypothetical protein [Candidatus Aminicenantes bacterium]
MIKDSEYLRKFENDLLAKESSDLSKNLALYEAMWEEAKALGIFPLKDPLDGVEDDIRLAKVLRRLPKQNV